MFVCCGRARRRCVFGSCQRTHGVSAVQFLQQGVVGAFGEAALLVDKSQHAQFLERKRRKEKRRKEGAEGERVMTE